MKRLELDLMRLLHGELPEEQARDLRARLESDPALAGEYRRLQRSWEGLSLPPAAPVPSGFARRVAARVRSEPSLSWSTAPGWVRAAAAAALVLGAALGAGVGGNLPREETQETEELSEIDGSLAESYWTAIEDLEP